MILKVWPEKGLPMKNKRTVPMQEYGEENLPVVEPEEEPKDRQGLDW